MAHNGNRLQVNLPDPAPYLERYAINAMKMVRDPCYALDSGGLPTDNAQYGKLNPRGYPYVPPAGVGSRWQFNLYLYGNPPDTYDLVYPSVHTLALASSVINFTNTDSTAGDKEYRINSISGSAVASHSVVLITAMQSFTGTAATVSGNVISLDGSPNLSAFSAAGEVGAYIYLAQATNNRRAFKITAVDNTAKTVTVSVAPTGVTSSTWMMSAWGDGIKVCRTVNRAAMDAGEIFDPTMLAHLGYPGNPLGIIRTGLGWGAVNSNHNKLHSEVAHWEADVSWSCAVQDARFFAGAATFANNTYTTPPAIQSTGSWVDGQIIQFYKDDPVVFKTITSVTPGNPTVFGCASHGIPDGSTIGFSISGQPTAFNAAFFTKLAGTGLPPQFTVTVINANSFSINLNSTGFAAATVPFTIYQTVKVTDGTLPAKRCVSEGIQTWYDTVLSADGLWTAQYFAEFDVCMLYAGGPKSWVPISVQAKLGNKIGAHVHFCVPFMYDAAAELELIAEVRATIDEAGGLLAFYEKGNEIFNTQFNANSQAQSRALKAFSDGQPQYGHADKVNNLAANLITAYGPASTLYRLGGGLQIGNTFANTLFLESPHVPGGVLLANKLDMVLSAPYVAPGMGHKQNGAVAANYPGYQDAINDYKSGVPSRMDEAYQWFADELRTNSATPLAGSDPLDEQLATTVSDIANMAGYTGRLGTGVKMEHYEGGHTIYGSNDIDGGFPTGGITTTDVYNYLTAVLLSQQYADWLFEYLQKMKAAGVEYPSLLSIANTWSTTGCWGEWRTQTWDEAASKAWTAASRFNQGYKRLRLTNVP